MNSIIKKTMIAATLFTVTFGWPIETETGIRIPRSVLKSCSREAGVATRKAIEKVQEAKIPIINRIVHILRNDSIHSNEQTPSQPNMVPCPKCCGHGKLLDNDGHAYTCNRCCGLGKIVAE